MLSFHHFSKSSLSSNAGATGVGIAGKGESSAGSAANTFDASFDIVRNSHPLFKSRTSRAMRDSHYK